MKKRSLPATTTSEEDLVTAGQRRINRIWEYTQATVAVMITVAVIYAEVNGLDAGVLSEAFFLIVSMYFIRTNHNLIGGIPRKHEGR